VPAIHPSVWAVEEEESSLGIGKGILDRCANGFEGRDGDLMIRVRRGAHPGSP
jgi:hypothetical protein